MKQSVNIVNFFEICYYFIGFNLCRSTLTTVLPSASAQHLPIILSVNTNRNVANWMKNHSPSKNYKVLNPQKSTSNPVAQKLIHQMLKKKKNNKSKTLSLNFLNKKELFKVVLKKYGHPIIEICRKEHIKLFRTEMIATFQRKPLLYCISVFKRHSPYQCEGKKFIGFFIFSN